MPESLHDLLAEAAGPPPQLDLDAVRSRGNAYRRNRRALLAVGTGSTAAALVTALVLLTGSPTTSLVPDAPATPGPVLPTQSEAREPDGVTYARLTEARGLSVTYNKVDYLKAACDARTDPNDIVPVEPAERICFRDANPRLRTLPLSPAARITEVYESGEEHRITPGELARRMPGSVWRMRISGGRIVDMIMFVVHGS